MTSQISCISIIVSTTSLSWIVSSSINCGYLFYLLSHGKRWKSPMGIWHVAEATELPSRSGKAGYNRRWLSTRPIKQNSLALRNLGSEAKHSVQGEPTETRKLSTVDPASSLTACRQSEGTILHVFPCSEMQLADVSLTLDAANDLRTLDCPPKLLLLVN